MSSEEMRIELETFVNAGLREGWRGWPVKAQADAGQTVDSRLYTTAGATSFDGRRDVTALVGPDQAFGTTRLFDWEHRRIRAGARLVSHQSNS